MMIIPTIPYLPALSTKNAGELLPKVGLVLQLQQINWQEFPHKPEVDVYLGHSGHSLFLHYVVRKDYVRAVNRNDQEPVYEDSCVEFFLQENENYRNFEFNALGVCLSAVGAERKSRRRLQTEELALIRRNASLHPDALPPEDVLSDWNLTVEIPFSMIGLERGKSFRGNFYKCGDETLIPHFVSWAPIKELKPDFHRPEFFAELSIA
ncbi:carbohydrate-binding family 9-like protein [Prolixibacter sp. NT017]|uniref:carbohydrate-binding family 9-like protein n=1 Tax=Prolixibacter sp. NT017 TaxID=2652390 RepID=UPI00127DF763|nr:carbohydrate-binding family 9-like protein [Prolixibacter sp. NT017]GET25175.1 hypothetical protein NT017_15040 [Prolixibacter sp. NT017]